MRFAAGDRLGPYEIVAPLGAGGMGEVYKARDPRLDRSVALKVLPAADFSDPERLARFRHEARAASALNHPHICAIYEVGEADGIPFIAMELVDGESLRATMTAAPLPVARALELARQIADALAKAHDAGITHRDIKPENILVSRDGYAKLVDFGLAKRDGGAVRALGSSVITGPGVVLGTVRYMSPEQAQGQPADARSDIFSLGLVLHEMVAGAPAFDGPSHVDVLHSIVHAPVAVEAMTRRGAPAEVVRIVAKATEKDPGDRYQSTRDLAVDLRHALRSLQSGASAPAAARGVWRGRRMLVAALGTALALAVVATLMWRARPATPAPDTPAHAAGVAGGRSRLVVLPFENLTRQAADDWLAGGFSDSLTFGLQSLDSLILVNREPITEIYRQESLREADPLSPQVVRRLSERLQVQYYVHGSYQRISDQIRVVARLVETGSGTIKAQESVTDRFANILQVEDELARRFAAALEAGSRAAPRAETASLEAYQAYTEARGAYAASTRSYAEARHKLKRAVALDSSYAAAWALLGKLTARMAAPGVIGAGDSVDELRREALAAATRAAELAPSSYEAHVALALAYRENRNRERWRSEALAAVNLNPRMAEAYALVADSYSAISSWGCAGDRDYRLADEYYRRALDIDPLLGPAYNNLGVHLRETNRSEEAIRVCDRGLAALPNYLNLKRHRAENLLRLKRVDEAGAELEALLRDREPNLADLSVLAHLDIARGRIEAAEQQAQKAPGDLLLGDALAMATYGQPIRAAHIFERAFKIDPACASYVASTPSFAPFVSLPPIRELLARYGAAK